MTETTTILPCPFCGGDAHPDKVLREGYERYQDDEDAWAHFMRCRSCACHGPWQKSLTSAVRWWNGLNGVDLSERVKVAEGRES